MAVPVVPPAAAALPASARPTMLADDPPPRTSPSKTIVSTAAAAPQPDDEIEIPVGESCIAPSPVLRHRPRASPTFEHLTVATGPSRVWAYAVCLAVAAAVLLLLWI
jgi:hypothetical protein